ncbi:MAG: hypothetical protein K2X66_03315 [Cyanobacteria bacterium]|nr:hypothetical protein [Cyanobacteriota bacterium]
MARFKYRLQKVFELRERRKKEQEEAVVKAQARVREVEERIQAKKNEIRLLKQNMLTAPHTLMAAHDEFIHTKLQELDSLYLDLQAAKDLLEWEKQLLLKAHSELEALVKHKEKAIEMWKEEEKQKEMKQLDEVAGQRYFRQQQEKIIEELEDDALLAQEALDDAHAQEVKAENLLLERMKSELL